MSMLDRRFVRLGDLEFLRYRLDHRADLAPDGILRQFEVRLRGDQLRMFRAVALGGIAELSLRLGLRLLEPEQDRVPLQHGKRLQRLGRLALRRAAHLLVDQFRVQTFPARILQRHGELLDALGRIGKRGAPGDDDFLALAVLLQLALRIGELLLQFIRLRGKEGSRVTRRLGARLQIRHDVNHGKRIRGTFREHGVVRIEAQFH